MLRTATDERKFASVCPAGCVRIASVTGEPVYEVVWPRSAQATQRRRIAERLDSLGGRRVAFLWEYMFRGDELFPVLADELRSRYGVEVVGYDEFGNTHGPDEARVVAELPDALRRWRVDAAVSGVGC